MMRRRLRALIAAVVLATLGALLVPMGASAHALAQSSVPAGGSTVQQAPSQVSVSFGEAPDVRLSTLAVLGSSGQSFDAGPVRAAPGDDQTLVVPVKPLPRGVYTISWRTVSSVDGHYAAGSIVFGVGESPDTAATTASVGGTTPPPSALAVAGRWTLFAGLVLLIGAGVVCGAVLRDAPRRLAWLAAGAWVLVDFGIYAVSEAQRTAAGAS